MALKLSTNLPLTLSKSPTLEYRPLTSIYENRQQDKNKVESELLLSEVGNNDQIFYTNKGDVLATGYNRIVYGDHGPYIEFSTDQIKCPLYRKFNQIAKADAFYEWLIPKGDPSVKVYYQLRTVENLKNPPPGGFRGNREEGYADYQIGFIYISPWDLKVEPSPHIGMSI